MFMERMGDNKKTQSICPESARGTESKKTEIAMEISLMRHCKTGRIIAKKNNT